MTKMYAVCVALGLGCGIAFADSSLNSDVDFAGFYGDEDYVSIATGTTQQLPKHRRWPRLSLLARYALWVLEILIRYWNRSLAYMSV